MDLIVERILLFLVGAIFLGAGGKFIIDSMDAKDLIESTLFGAMGVAIGLFLVVMAFVLQPG